MKIILNIHTACMDKGNVQMFGKFTGKFIPLIQN